MTITEYIFQLTDGIRDLINAGEELKCELPYEDYADTKIVNDWSETVERLQKLVGDK